MGEYQSAVAIELVDDFHVVLAMDSCLDSLHDAGEFCLRRLDEHDLGGEDFVGGDPVGAGHSHWCRREREKFIHGL
jgi:hypothetical protein